MNKEQRTNLLDMQFWLSYSFTLFFTLTTPMALSQNPSPVSIQADIERLAVTKNEKAVVTISLTNAGRLRVKGFDIQIISPAFKVITEKDWQDTLYPNSSLVGLYALEPSQSGTFPLYLSYTYTLDNTASRPPIVKQISSSEKIDDIYVSIKQDKFMHLFL